MSNTPSKENGLPLAMVSPDASDTLGQATPIESGGGPAGASTVEIAVHADSAVRALVSFLEHEPQPMIVLDPTYRILSANAAYRHQFGEGGKPHVGRRCYEVSHHYSVPCDQAGEHCPMKQALAQRSPDRVLHIHHTPRGPEHVDVELRPIMDSQGAVIAFVERLATVRNATAQPQGRGLVGRSPAFNRALTSLQRVAPSTLPVLLLGESGTGKELFARAVHEASTRARGPFVTVDCSGITESLFESELFGYERGAFTGATARKPGLVETAKSGTLFLDEIGDVPLAMQVKLLRLIESGTFRRVGGIETLHADFRLVAATHKPIKQMIEDGQFRADLYYRISAFPIVLPPMRERRADIRLLADALLKRIERVGVASSITPQAMAVLEAYSWPGNIRELRNVLERACLLADGDTIGIDHLSQELLERVADHITPVGDGVSLIPSTTHTASPDGEVFQRLVAEFSGSRRALAAHLGISERTLYRRLRDIK